MSQTTLNGGNSATAQYLADKMSEHQQFLHKSAAVGMGGLIREELADVWDECRVPDWDGYNGFPVSWDAYNNAKRFLLALPLGVSATQRFQLRLPCVLYARTVGAGHGAVQLPDRQLADGRFVWAQRFLSQ